MQCFYNPHDNKYIFRNLADILNQIRHMKMTSQMLPDFSYKFSSHFFLLEFGVNFKVSSLKHQSTGDGNSGEYDSSLNAFWIADVTAHQTLPLTQGAQVVVKHPGPAAW